MTVWMRAAQPTDAGRAGDILWQFQQRNDWMPSLYTGAQAIGFCGAMIDRGWVTVALDEDGICGFIAQDETEICALYLSPKTKGRGVGRMLLDQAKQRSSNLWLRCFLANTGAIRFYGREGFVEKTRSNGAGTEENLPNVTFVWSKETAT